MCDKVSPPPVTSLPDSSVDLHVINYITVIALYLYNIQVDGILFGFFVTPSSLSP
jgi:hypothetical protein